MRSSISSGKNGNVTAQDDTSILFSFGDTIQIPSGEELSVSDSNLIRKYNLESHYHQSSTERSFQVISIQKRKAKRPIE